MVSVWSFDLGNWTRSKGMAHCTRLKFNMEAENKQPRKGDSFGNHHFQIFSILFFWGEVFLIPEILFTMHNLSKKISKWPATFRILYGGL